MAPNKDAGFAVDLDALTVEQALIDFEIANERVRDLTTRLVEANVTIKQLREQLAGAEVRSADLERRVASVEGTRAYQLAHRLWEIRGVLRV